MLSPLLRTALDLVASALAKQDTAGQLAANVHQATSITLSALPAQARGIAMVVPSMSLTMVLGPAAYAVVTRSLAASIVVAS